jgi:hypothetical protein
MLGLCRVALIIIEEDINHAVCSSLLLSLITNTFLHPKFVPSLSSRVVDYYILVYLHVHFLKSVCHCHHFLLYPSSYILYYLCYLLSFLIYIYILIKYIIIVCVISPAVMSPWRLWINHKNAAVQSPPLLGTNYYYHFTIIIKCKTTHTQVTLIMM